MNLADALDPIPDGAGPIGLLSGDEFTPPVAAFDRALLDLTGSRVALLLCADHQAAHRSARIAIEHFATLEATTATLDLQDHGGRVTGRLPDYDVLYIGGGDPRQLLACMRGSKVWDEIVQRWRAGAALVGSSAGAMALATECLVAREGDDRPTVWTEGLGPLEGVGLAVHVTTRPESWRRHVVEISRLPVLAIDDATGVLLSSGNAPVVIGPGAAWVERAGRA